MSGIDWDLVDYVVESGDESTTDVNDARALPPQCYTSYSFFEFEKRALFDREWLCVGRADLIPNPGDYLTITINDDPLLVVHGLDGHIRVMTAVCQHRSHLLAEVPGHTDRIFRCPLHYWSYDTEGRVVNATGMKKARNFDKSDYCLPQLKVEVWEGFIFANHDWDAKPLAPTLSKLSDEMVNYDVAHMVSIPTMDIPDYAWNWKQMIENAMEPFHTHFLHKGPHDFAPWPDFVTWDDDDGQIMHPTRFVVRDGAFNAIHKALLPTIEALTEEQHSRVMFATVPPLLFLGLVPDHMFYFLILPEGPRQITLRVGLSFPPASMQTPNFEHIVKMIIDGIMIYNDEDVKANTSVQKGMRSRYASRGRYAAEEETLPQLNRWLVRRYRDFYNLARAGGRVPAGVS